MQRVVITGQGAINALGRSAAETMEAMREGRSGIGALDFQDVERLSIAIGGQIRDYRPEEGFSRQELTLYDKFTQFALLAAAEAVTQSGLEIGEELSERAGVVLGTSGGGLQTQDENYRLVYQEGKNRVHPVAALDRERDVHPLGGPHDQCDRLFAFGGRLAVAKRHCGQRTRGRFEANLPFGIACRQAPLEHTIGPQRRPFERLRGNQRAAALAVERDILFADTRQQGQPCGQAFGHLPVGSLFLRAGRGELSCLGRVFVPPHQ
jgi:hypothetical protein